MSLKTAEFDFEKLCAPSKLLPLQETSVSFFFASVTRKKEEGCRSRGIFLLLLLLLLQLRVGVGVRGGGEEEEEKEEAQEEGLQEAEEEQGQRQREQGQEGAVRRRRD